MSIGFRCVACGRHSSGKLRECPHCKACLLVDVLVDAQDLDPRAIYLAAKKIDLLGGEAPDFDELRDRLRVTPSRIAGNCTRELAKQMIDILHRQGIPARYAHLRRPRRKILENERFSLKVRRALKGLQSYLGTFSKARKLTFGALFLLGGGLMVVTWIGLSKASSGTSPGKSIELPVSRSGREIAFDAIRSSAELTSHARRGLGFFVAPNLLVSSVRLADEEGDSPEIVMSGGDRRVGRVEKSNEWVGLSLIRLEGPGVPFLELGDATELERGEALNLLNRSGKSELSMAQSVVTQPLLTDLGRLYFLIAAQFASDGAPVLDRSGRVVGIITEGIPCSEGVYPVIPVNALINGEKALLSNPVDRNADKRWEERMEAVRREDRAAFAKLRSGLSRPRLESARISDPQTIEVRLFEVALQAPSGEELFFEVLRGREVLCRLNQSLTEWEEVTGEIEDARLYRRLVWMRHHLPEGRFYFSRIRLVSWACSEDLSGASLSLASGAQGGTRVPIRP